MLGTSANGHVIQVHLGPIKFVDYTTAHKISIYELCGLTVFLIVDINTQDTTINICSFFHNKN